MQSGSLQPDYERNGSFGATKRQSQIAKSGVESSTRAPESAEANHHRRLPSKETYGTRRAPLAERIRERETE